MAQAADVTHTETHRPKEIETKLKSAVQVLAVTADNQSSSQVSITPGWRRAARLDKGTQPADVVNTDA